MHSSLNLLSYNRKCEPRGDLLNIVSTSERGKNQKGKEGDMNCRRRHAKVDIKQLTFGQLSMVGSLNGCYSLVEVVGDKMSTFKVHFYSLRPESVVTLSQNLVIIKIFPKIPFIIVRPLSYTSHRHFN